MKKFVVSKKKTMIQLDLGGRDTKVDKPSCAPVLKRCGSQMLYHSYQWKHCKSADKDRLSELPEDILVSILSRLTLKEAMRTSVLSPRWRNLWTYTTGTLDFHYSEEKLSLADSCLCISKPKYFEILYDKSPLSVKRLYFIQWVNHVLSLHQGPTIEEFDVSAESNGSAIREEYIKKWVEFALGKRVKRLKLDLRATFNVRCVHFTLTKPLLQNFELQLSSLTVLSLNNVEVRSHVVHYVLLKCFVLEELHIEESSSLKKLKVPGPLPQLKCLKIICCHNLKWMKIHAIKVSSFTYDGHDIPITFKTAPQLVNASLRGCYASYFVKNIGKYSSYIKHVESLMLQLSRLNKYLSDEVLPELPFFENLRVLELTLTGFSVENTYNFCAAFLKNCPLLTRLTLSMSLVTPTCGGDHYKKDWWTIGSSDCLHSQLKVIELVNFDGDSESIVQVHYWILSGLPSLDQVILRPSIIWNMRDKNIQLNINDLSNKLKMMHPKAQLIIPSS